MSQNIFRTRSCNAKQCGTPADALLCERHLAMVPPALRHVIAASSDPDSCPTAIITAAIDAVAHKESRAAASTPRESDPKPIATAQDPPKKPRPARRPPKAKRPKPLQLALFDL